MGFFGRLFGTEKALDSAVDGVKRGLDALVYTDEEKATDAAKDRSEARAMVIGWMQSTQGQNLARRIIALCITGFWLSMYGFSVLFQAASVFVDSSSEKLSKVGDIALYAAKDMNPAVMLILAFYFAAPHMGDLAKAVTNRFAKSERVG